MGCNSSNQAGLENVNKKPVSVSILGIINSGKTSIIEYLAGEYNVDNPPIPTSGVVIRDISIHNVLFRFFDIGSSGVTNANYEENINNSNAAIYVIDCNTFEQNKKAINELFEKSAHLIVKKRLPIVVIINKVKEETPENSQKEIEEAIESRFGSEIKKKIIKMNNIDDQIFSVLQWICDRVKQSNK